jgi:hypothetical protein
VVPAAIAMRLVIAQDGLNLRVLLTPSLRFQRCDELGGLSAAPGGISAP